MLTTNRVRCNIRTSRSMRGVSGDDPADGAGVASRRSAVREVGCRRLGSIRAPAARPSRRCRRQCRNRSAGLARPKTVTAERREASAPIARCAPRPNRRGTRTRNRRLSALRHPLGGMATRGRIPGAPNRRGSGESCGSKRIAVRKNRKNECWGTSGTGLFDIVNGVRCASPRAQPGDLNATRSGEAPRIAAKGFVPVRCVGPDPQARRNLWLVGWVEP
jgi:hypothetical protein